MLQLRKILFPTDFSACAESAFAHAVHLAGRFDAELHVLNVALPYEEDPNNPMAHYALRKEDFVTWTDEASGGVETGHLRMIHAQMRVVSPAMGIISYADDHDMDLVVMGTHGRHGIDRLFLGSVAEEVVRLSTCPVFTVRQHTDATQTPVEAIRRILVPIDYSPSSTLSLAYARELAATYGARLDLLHVVQDAVLPTAYGVEATAVAVPEVLDRARQALVDLIDQTPGADVPTTHHVFIGNPAYDIVDFAADVGADLIVIATHGLTGIKRLLLGSITEKVVRRAPCPVFTVKSFGKSLLPADLVLTPAEAL